MKEDNARIHEIDAELADPTQSSDLWEPELNPKEVRTCMYVCMYMDMCVCTSVSVCVCVRVFLCESVCVSECVCIGVGA